MVKRRRPPNVPPKKLLDTYWGFSKISKLIVLLILTSVIVMGASAESKISSIMIGMDKSEIGGKFHVNEINFEGKEKKVRRVKLKGGKKKRNYFPITEVKINNDPITTLSVASKATTMSTSTTSTASTSTSTLSTTPTPTDDNYQLMTVLSTSKPSYVNIIRNTGVITNTTQTPLFNIQEDSSPSNHDLLEDRTEFSRGLPASDDDDQDDDDRPMQSRTSSRLLFPPAIKSTASPTSYMTSLTPEFNHVSWLTHPSSTPPPFSLGKMFGFTESEVDYQTNFKTFKSSDPSVKRHSTPKPKYFKNHSFFQMGEKQHLTTSKPPLKKIHVTTVSSIKSPDALFGFKKTTTPVSQKRQFVSMQNQVVSNPFHFSKDANKITLDDQQTLALNELLLQLAEVKRSLNRVSRENSGLRSEVKL